VLTLPHSSPETALLSQFWQVPARPESTFSHTLYLLHRASLPSHGSITVRRATVSDHLSIKAVVQGLAVADELLACVGREGGDGESKSSAALPTAFVAECQNQVIAVCTMAQAGLSAADVASIRHGYDVERFLAMDEYSTKNLVRALGGLVGRSPKG